MKINYYIDQKTWETNREYIKVEQRGTIHADSVPSNGDFIIIGGIDLVVQYVYLEDVFGLYEPTMTIGDNGSDKWV